jgi:flagellum-specific ATP synthase
VTRFARAQREIGLAIGEPPANRGFTPSVFAQLPKLLERSGTSDRGTVTAFYNILVEGDDLDEPVSDAVRGILDGHIILARTLASRHHYPAIDVLESISRLTVQITGPKIQEAVARIKRLMATYRDAEDLINVGAYVQGSNPEIDLAVEKMADINEYLIQGITEKADINDSLKRLMEISGVDIPAEELVDEAVSVQA